MGFPIGLSNKSTPRNVKTTSQLLELSADERASIVNRHATNAARLEDSGRKETAKTMAVMEKAGDIGEKDLKTYLKNRGIDVSKLKGVYEIARVARATLASEIAMTETQFDRAASSKLQILSRGFQDEFKDDVLPVAVALVIDDAPASEIRKLFASEKDKPALIVDDIPENGIILTSEKVRQRLTDDFNNLIDPETNELRDHVGANKMLTRASRLFVMLATITGEDPHQVVDDVLATMAAMTAEAEAEAAAA